MEPLEATMMEVEGVDEVILYWAGTGKTITVRHPTQMVVDKERRLRHYICRNGTNVIVRNTWDVCTIIPTVLVKKEVEAPKKRTNSAQN